MTAPVKPADLVAIHARLASTQGSGNAVNALLYHDIPAMSDEIEAWREAGAAMLKRLKYEPIGIETLHAVEALRALLPPTKLDDAREKFEDSLRPVVRAPKPTAEEVAAWGREFEASAVRMPHRKVCSTCGQYPGLCGHPLPPS